MAGFSQQQKEQERVEETQATITSWNFSDKEEQSTYIRRN